MSSRALVSSKIAQTKPNKVKVHGTFLGGGFGRKVEQDITVDAVLLSKITGKPIIVVQNIVASASLGAELNLEKAAMELENTLYEPEQFPGLIYRMRDPKVVILLFGSGKLVITGAKFEPQIDEAALKVMNRLLELSVMRIPEEWDIDEDEYVIEK